VAAVGLGLLYGLNATSLMDIYTLSSGVLTASIAISAFAMFSRWANKTGVIWGALLGFAGNVIFYILEYKIWAHHFAPKWLADTNLGYIMVGLAASVIGLVVGSWIGKPATVEQLTSIAPKPIEGVEVFDLAKESQPS
jgi:Na+(H+)/acetate symporter ActP